MSTTEEINDTHTAAGQASHTKNDFKDIHSIAEQGLRIECSMNGARTLLESWERADHKGAPRSAQASADFHLPFLAVRPGRNKPHIALWEKDGLPDGILIGRHCLQRPKLSLSKIPIPMPRLRILEISSGGLETHSCETAHRQAAYLRQLLTSRYVDRITIYNLPLDSEIGRILKNGLRHAGDGKPEITGHWFAELTDEGGTPIVNNSAKTRSSFRRMDRKLCNFFDHKVELREFHTPDRLVEFIPAAARIGQSTYQGEIGVGVNDDAIWHKKLGIYAANGDLRAYLLLAGGKPVAYAVGALWEGTYTGFATSFLPEYRTVSPGGYLLRRMIEKFQQEGVRWFDFGVPDYGYKEIYGTLRREDASLVFDATTPAAITASVLDAAVKKTGRTMHQLLEVSGLRERSQHQRDG